MDDISGLTTGDVTPSSSATSGYAHPWLFLGDAPYPYVPMHVTCIQRTHAVQHAVAALPATQAVYYPDLERMSEQEMCNAGIGLIAAYHGHHSVIQAYIHTGMDVHVTDQYGETIGHRAVHGGHADILSTWMHVGGDVHARTCLGTTIGHIAAHHGYDHMLTTWMDAGGDMHAVTSQGQTIGHSIRNVSFDGSHVGYRRSRNEIHAGRMACAHAWVRRGGCILSGTPDAEVYQSWASIPVASDHHALIVIQACLRIMGYTNPWNPVDHGRERMAFQSAEGIAMADRLISRMSDPLHMATFAQHGASCRES